jgi:predicted transposase YdaD
VDIVSGQHDEFFKALMEQPGAAGALLRERLPQEIAALLAEGEPELVKGSFIDEELSESHSDRLYRVQLASGGSAYVYCLIEHKSAPDARVGLQLLRYLVRIWERLDREAKGRGLLPPVIPLVVYHGADAWSGPVRFSQLLAGSEAVKAQGLDFPFRVVDVGRIDDADLSRHRRLQAGLLVLKCVMLMKTQGRIEVLEYMLSSVADPRGTLKHQLRASVRFATTWSWSDSVIWWKSGRMMHLSCASSLSFRWLQGLREHPPAKHLHGSRAYAGSRCEHMIPRRVETPLSSIRCITAFWPIPSASLTQ